MLSTQSGLYKHGFEHSPLVQAHLNGNLFGNDLCIPFSVHPFPHPHLSDGCSAKRRGRNELSVYHPTEDKKTLSTSVVCFPSLADHFQIIQHRPSCLLGILVYAILVSSWACQEFLAVSQSEREPLISSKHPHGVDPRAVARSSTSISKC